MYRIAAGAAGAHRETVGVPARSVDEDRRRLGNNNNNTPSTTSNDNVMPGNDPEQMRTRRYARRRSIARHTVSVLVRAENDQSDQSLMSLL